MAGLRAGRGPRDDRPAAGGRPAGARHLRGHADPLRARRRARRGDRRLRRVAGRRGAAAGARGPAHGLEHRRRRPRAPRCSPASRTSGSTSCTPTPCATGRCRPTAAPGAPLVTWAEHGGDRFVAAVENGPLVGDPVPPREVRRRRRGRCCATGSGGADEQGTGAAPRGARARGGGQGRRAGAPGRAALTARRTRRRAVTGLGAPKPPALAGPARWPRADEGRSGSPCRIGDRPQRAGLGRPAPDWPARVVRPGRQPVGRARAAHHARSKADPSDARSSMSPTPRAAARRRHRRRPGRAAGAGRGRLREAVR